MKKLYDEIDIKNKIESLAEEIGRDLVAEVQSTIQEKKLVMDSSLLNSISSDIEDRSTKETVSYLVKVFGNVNYGVFVHEGTRPHFPPIEPILHWVKQKGIGQEIKYKASGKGTLKGSAYKQVKTKNGLTERAYSKEVRSVAYAIAKSISRKGTRGVKFFEIAYAQAKPEIIRKIKETL